MVKPYHVAEEEDANAKCGQFPRTLNLNFVRKQTMRYGEKRPIKNAAFYVVFECERSECGYGSKSNCKVKPCPTIILQTPMRHLNA